MRHSLLLRLLAVSFGVAALAVAATALLATYGTGSQLRDQVAADASLLEVDSLIYQSLLEYAHEHADWVAAEPLVRELAAETGRRIALTAPDGAVYVDSAELLGHGGADLPSVPAARIDAAEPFVTGQQIQDGAVTSASHQVWRLTAVEREQRQVLADEAVGCLRDDGIAAEIQIVDGQVVVSYGADEPAGGALPDWPSVEIASTDLLAHPCVPPELFAPSAAALARNAEELELATACLDRQGQEYRVDTDQYGWRALQPPAVAGGQWRDCEEQARTAALRPYLVPAADLYLGGSDRFDPFSGDGWWRTAAAVAAVLLVAAVVTVLAGRRMLRPIRELTAAARAMAAGDRAARVPETGYDEVTRLAGAFNAMAESIGQSERDRRAFISDIAHELRTPLTNVRSQLEAAEEGVLPVDAALLRSVAEETGLLTRLVGDLQELALADAGMLAIHPEERDAADLAAQTVAAHAPSAEAAGVVLRLASPDSVPLYADPARIRQAVGNLLVNALTHTPAGGTVTVTVGAHGDEVVFAVADTGSGIDPGDLPHVFDRFYRADRSRSRATGGSGLGLSITRHLAQAHGGRVEASSVPGSGTTVRIVLPTRPPGSTSGWRRDDLVDVMNLAEDGVGR